MEWVTVLGLVAASCTTIAYLPQTIKAIKTKHTKDLSLIMYSILTLGLVMWLAYGILVRDIPLIMANSVSLVLSAVILTMKIRYG